MPQNNNVSSDGDCIVMLTDAEKKARLTIEAAKKRKMTLMKKAKDDSAGEIEIFRKENEQAVNKIMRELSNGQEQTVSRIEQNFQNKKSILNEEFKLNRLATLNFILQLVLNIEPKTHGNLVIHEIKSDLQ